MWTSVERLVEREWCRLLLSCFGLRGKGGGGVRMPRLPSFSVFESSVLERTTKSVNHLDKARALYSDSEGQLDAL